MLMTVVEKRWGRGVGFISFAESGSESGRQGFMAVAVAVAVVVLVIVVVNFRGGAGGRRNDLIDRRAGEFVRFGVEGFGTVRGLRRVG